MLVYEYRKRKEPKADGVTFEVAEFFRSIWQAPRRMPAYSFFASAHMTDEMRAEAAANHKTAETLAKVTGANAAPPASFTNTIAAKYYKVASAEVKEKIKEARETQYQDEVTEWETQMSAEPLSAEDAAK